MAIYGYEPPDLELARIEEQKAKQNQYNAVKSQIESKPEIGINLEGIVNKFGNVLSRDVMVGSALLGFTEESPEISALVQRQIEIEQEESSKLLEKFKSVGRGSVRSLFVGLDSLAEALIKRPYQATARAAIDGGLSPQWANLTTLLNFIAPGAGDNIVGVLSGDEDFQERYKAAKAQLGPTVAGEAIRKLAKGEKVNLGRGYFGNSTLARDTEIYKQIASTIKDPSQLQAIEAVIQEQLGTPITALERERVERNTYRGQVISPGRIMAMNFAEPGTERYRKVSGLIDGVVTLGLDPANLAGAWVTKLTKAGKTFTTGNKMNGWLTARSTGADIYQAVKIKEGDKLRKGIRYVDVGDNVLTDSVYTIDELNKLAREGGKSKALIFSKDGKHVTRSGLNKIRNEKGELRGLAGRTFNRIDDGDSIKILIDREEISKTVASVGPQQKVKFGVGRKGIDQDGIKDFEDYVDFILEHEAVHAAAYNGDAPAMIQKLHDAKDALIKAGKGGTDEYYKAFDDYEEAINIYVSGARKGRLNDIERAKNASGLSKVLRPSLNKTRFEEWHNSTGRQIYEFIHTNVQKGGLTYMDIRKLMPDLDPASIDAILKANSADTVGDIIAANVRSGNITKRLDPYSYTFRGHLSRGVGKTVNRNNKLVNDGGRIDFSDMGDFLGIGAVVTRKAADNKMYKLFKENAPSYITTHSTIRGFKELEKVIDSLPFTADKKKELFERLAASNKKINNINMDGRRTSKLQQTEEFYNILLGTSDTADKGLLGELEKMMASRGMFKEFSGGIQKFIAEIRESRRYWVSLVGDDVIDVGFSGSKSSKAGQQIIDATQTQLNIDELSNLTTKASRDDIEEFITNVFDGDVEFAQPTAQLMSEMLTGNIPLPDMNETYRVLGTFRNTLYQMTGLHKLGPARIDLPQLLSSPGYTDDLAKLAKTNDEFASYIAGWKYPTLDNTTIGGGKNVRKTIERMQKKARKELLDEYERITGKKFAGQFDETIQDVFNLLDDPKMVQEAFGAGNIAANAVTKNLAKIFYKYDKDANKLINSALVRIANNSVTQVWKPFQLLRVAWTVRVISEEQLRMFAADLSNVYTHPISHIAYVMNRKAATDIIGNDFAEALLFKQGMSKGSGGILIRKADSIDRYFDVFRRDSVINDTAARRRYAQGWATELQLLSDDSMAVEVARIISGKGKGRYQTLDELAAALVDGTADDQLVKQYRAWAEEADAKTIAAKRQITIDKDRTLEFLESLQARIIEKTGGEFKKYIEVNGKKIEIPKGVVYNNAKDPNGLPLRMYYDIDTHGSKANDLIEGIATGEVKFGSLNDAGEFVGVKVPIGSKGSRKQYDILTENLGRLVEDGPSVVKVSRNIDKRPGVGSSYNNLVNTWFDILMSSPTNKLSRSPAFKQFYYQRVGQSAYTLNAEALQEVIKQARVARVDKKILKQLENTTPTIGGVNIRDLDKFDEMSKAIALNDVQELLYDLNKRSQFSEATALLFPFAEVHKEIVNTWTRLLRNNPTKARKMQITVDSLKESDPNNSGDSFIYTDPLTNEEVFVIPIVDKIMNNYFQKGQFFGGENITDETTRMRTVGFTSSANIVAGGIIPGVGPAVQIAVDAMLPNLKENSAIYKTVFPFGAPESVSSYLIPSWIRKFAGLSKKAPESWQRQYLNTQKDLMKAKLLAGHLDLSSDEKLKMAIQNVKQEAFVMTIIRGGVQGTFLTGGSYRWEKEVMPGGELYMNPEELVKSGLDPDGRYFAMNVLATAYYQILREYGGDQVEADQRFAQLFGYNPTALLISKSKEVRRTPYTEPGLAQANEQFFQDLPDAAYYFQPDSPLDEFSYVAWIQSFTVDALGDGIARYDLQLNEWAALYNMAAGRLAMEKKRRELTDPMSDNYIASKKVRNEMLYRFNEALREVFPGYDIQPRTPGPTDMDNVLRQLREGANRDDMKDNDVAKALKIYFESYDNFEKILKIQAGSPRVSPKRLTAFYVREEFRKHAEDLYTKYPEFYYVWQDILSKQIEEDLIKLIEEGVNL
tara:strand:- start:4839 stop:10931 length:6093 start_codon:yes stop_codon:yes gene_type:complete